ncbi:hypothetical protein MRX96_019993 [Rhipicephalus microplus]
MHSPRHNSVPDAHSPIAASPSAESAPIPAPTSEEPARRPFCHRRSENLPTNKVQVHRHLFFEKIATDNIQAIVEKWLQANPVAQRQAPHAGLPVRQRRRTCHQWRLCHRNCRGAATKPHADRSSWADTGACWRSHTSQL